MYCSDDLHNASARRTSMLFLVVLTLVQRLWAAPPGGGSSCISWWNWAGGNAPGVGYEFETGDLRFTNPLCTTLQETNDLKWKRITQIGRDRIGGRFWELTVDDSLLMPGALVAEVILDGTKLRVGYPDAANTAEEAALAIINVDPVRFNGQRVVILQGSTYGPWTISTPNSPNPRSTLQFIWYSHVTAPLPLQSIQDLIVKAVALEENWLLPHAPTEDFTYSVLGKNFIAVKRSFFQSPAIGINPNHVTDDMLGFFSMVLSYAKHADDVDSDSSPKYLLSIMPRTDFTTIFNTLRRFVPGTYYPNNWRPGSLYSLIKILACYVEIDSVLDIDETYCTGEVDDPEPTDAMDDQFFDAGDEDGDGDVTVQEWINSIQNNIYPDALTTFDQRHDSQIGGFRNRMEYVAYTTLAQGAMDTIVHYHAAYKQQLDLQSPV